MPRWITIDRLWLVLPALLTLMYVGGMVQYPLDFWFHAATGRLMADTGTISDHDTFTYTIAGQPVVYQSWLSARAIYELFRIGGFPFVQFVAAVCYAAAIGATTAGAWCRCRSARIAAALALVTLGLAISNFGIRTQAVSFVLFAVELLTLWQWPDRWRTALIVGAAEAIWTNTHGAFPLGIALPGLFLTARLWDITAVQVLLPSPASGEGLGVRAGRVLKAIFIDRSVRVLAVCVLVSLVTAFCNPQPSRTLAYVFNLTSRASERGIEEWQPIQLDTFTGVAMLASILLAIVIVMFGRKRPQAIELLLLLAFGALALGAQRMVIWWAMVLPSILAPHLARIFHQLVPLLGTSSVVLPTCVKHCLFQAVAHDNVQTSRTTVPQRILNAMMLLVLGLAVLMSTPWTRAYNPLLPPSKRGDISEDEPRGAVEFLQESIYHGRAFHPMEWGAYLTWHFDPEIKVFVDGRIDFFPDQVWNDYARIGNAEPGWQALLDQYQVELIVWNRQLSDKLPTALAQSGRWKKVYQDSLAVIFVRNVPSPSTNLRSVPGGLG